MKLGLRTMALVFLAVPAFAGPLHAAEGGPYPIWWSDELELESLDRVEARLRRDLWLDIPEGMKLYKSQGDGHVTVQAQDCESLSRLSEDDYYGGGSNGIGIQNHQLSVCRAIALLGQAKPARVSHLRDFVLNAGALEFLPALVNLYPSCEFICYAVEANKRGIPFTKFETVLVVDVENKEIVVWTVGWMVRLTILARGDFTADGVDDLLLLSSGGATEGSLSTASLYLMTRDAPGAILRVIDAERELCPDYNCPGASLFFTNFWAPRRFPRTTVRTTLLFRNGPIPGRRRPGRPILCGGYKIYGFCGCRVSMKSMHSGLIKKGSAMARASQFTVARRTMFSKPAPIPAMAWRN